VPVAARTVMSLASQASIPVVLLTSDPDDMNWLVEEPVRPKEERIVVVRV